MTYPRSHLVSERSRGIYHVHSRCVRRAWLCGVDREAGRDFTHRRIWIEHRILELAEYFSVSIYGYAVMSNHYHIVLEMRPEACTKWTDEEVIDRWLAVCPGRKGTGPREEEKDRLRRQALLDDPERVEVLRRRLGSLSWFMRFVNEPLARMANREDQCTGRFWQGRFHSQRLLDEAAVLAAMVYVDLNPVRAGIAEEVTECRYTSIRARLDRQRLDERLEPLNAGTFALSISPMVLSDYLGLVRWTAQAQRERRRGGEAVHPSLTRRQIALDEWLRMIPRPGCWRRALGSVQALRAYAESLGQRWIQTRSRAVAY